MKIALEEIYFGCKEAFAVMNMNAENKDLTTLDEFKDEIFGRIDTKERDEYEAGFENFMIGAYICTLIQFRI